MNLIYIRLQLGNRIDLIDTTIRKLVSMCAHLDKLKDQLHKEGEEYLKNWQVSVDENHVWVNYVCATGIRACLWFT